MKKLLFLISTGILITSLLFLGCANAGAGGGGSSSGDGEATDFNELEMMTLPSQVLDQENIDNENAFNLAFSAYLSILLGQSYLQLVTIEWDDTFPSSYHFNEGEITYTVTWSQDGNSWTWTITGGGSTVVISIVDTGEGYELTISDGELPLLSGTLSSDGQTGSMSISDGEVSYTVTWAPAAAPYEEYDYGVSISASGGESLSLWFTEDGSSGYWWYTTLSHQDSGSWPQLPE